MPNSAAENLGTPKLITLHWTAGSYTQTYPHYHFCVLGNGTTMRTLPLTDKGSHTWGRNTGNIGIAMCCMQNTRTMPTNRQIEETAALIADLSIQFNIGLDDVYPVQRHKVSNSIRVPIDGTIEVFRITDHAAYARADGYYPDRWDCGRYTNEIVKKAKWYAAEVNSGDRPRRSW